MISVKTNLQEFRIHFWMVTEGKGPKNTHNEKSKPKVLEERSECALGRLTDGSVTSPKDVSHSHIQR